MKDRTEYQRKYYQKHKEQRKADYKSYESYVKLVDAKKVLTRHKKEIGEIAYNLLMDEMFVLNRVRLHGEVCVDSNDRRETTGT